MKQNRQKSVARLFLHQRSQAKSTKVCRKIVLAPEILSKIDKSLSQDCSCARDMKTNRQKSVARLFLHQRYQAKSTKVCRKIVLAPEILSKIDKSLSQDCSCTRDIKRNRQKSVARLFLR